jgi:hypothetical protein
LTDARRADETEFGFNFLCSLPPAANGIQEADGSMPFSSTKSPKNTSSYEGVSTLGARCIRVGQRLDNDGSPIERG